MTLNTINTYMRLKGVKRVELAKQMNTTPAEVSQILNGKKNCTPQMLDRILEALGFPKKSGIYPSIIAEIGAGLFTGMNAHVSASELSRLSGVSAVTIRKIRSMENLDSLRTDLEKLLKLADVLGVEYSWNGLKDELRKGEWF